MPAYHSQFNETASSAICSFAILPIKTQYKGPAPAERDANALDIIDETIQKFKANVLFRNFEFKGSADRVLVYLTLYISECLNKIRPTMGKDDAKNALYQNAIANFTVPGDANFALAGFVDAPKNRGEGDQIRAYLQQLRQECGNRLCESIYQHDASTPSKWWMCFSKKKFLNKAL